MTLEISLKRVSFMSSLGFLVVLALACANAGCVGSPDEVVDDTADPDDPIEPDLPEVGPIEPSEPAPRACTAGETLELGASNDWPALAATDEGYALIHREASPNQEPVLLVFDREGEPTGPATLFPGSRYMPRIAGGAHGYVIQSVSPGSLQASFYWAGQDGAVSASAVDVQWAGMQIDLTETKLRGITLTHDAGCAEGPYPFRFSVGDLQPDGGITDLVIGPCMPNGGWSWRGFAAHDDSALFISQSTVLVDGGQTIRVTANVFTDDGLRQLTIADGFSGESLWNIADVATVIATDDGYAILWNRVAWGIGQPQTNRSFLTFIGEYGAYLGTVEIGAHASDVAWNGREFGLVRDGYVEGVRSIIFDRLTDRGQTIETVAIPVSGDPNLSHRIAASGDDFAIAYGVNDGQGSLDLFFTPVSCQ